MCISTYKHIDVYVNIERYAYRYTHINMHVHIYEYVYKYMKI